MLFKADEEIKIVGSCPVALGSEGIMEFPPELISTIAGAVLDHIEWMVLLIGERSEDGFHVKVNSFKVPQQQRTSGNVSMDEPMEGPGSTVDESVVGVLHSHHRMGAFFSGTDERELNPFFKSSIVIAQDNSAALGFKYKAEGKVTLPCGSIGRIKFRLAITGSEIWNAQPIHEVEKNNRGFGDCDQLAETTTETEVEIVKAKTSACGLSNTLRTERPAVFGVVGGDQLLAEIRQMTTAPVFQNQRVDYGRYGGNYARQDQGHHQAGYLSRRERKRLKREGKLSARRDGTFGSFSSEDNGYHNVGGQDDRPEQLPHENALSRRMCSGEVCGLCALEETRQEWQYKYLGQRTGWDAWLCDDCYDFVMDGVLQLNGLEQNTDHAFVASTYPDNPLCVAQIPVEGHSSIFKICGRSKWESCHLADEFGKLAAEEKEKHQQTRERLNVAGLLPPAGETIH